MILGKIKPLLGRQKPQNLSEWLDQATGGLVPSAQARVRAEIEAHCAEAMQVQLKNGATEPEAQAAALADLGDAPAAAARFRREYLCNWDFDRVISLAWLQVYFGLLWGMDLVIHFLHPKSPGLAAGLLIALAFVVYIISLNFSYYFGVKRLPKVFTPRLVILLPIIAWLNVVTVIFLFFLHKERDPVADVLMRLELVPAMICMSGFAIGITLQCRRLRQKLKADDENDLPPRDPAAA